MNGRHNEQGISNVHSALNVLLKISIGRWNRSLEWSRSTPLCLEIDNIGRSNAAFFMYKTTTHSVLIAQIIT